MSKESAIHRVIEVITYHRNDCLQQQPSPRATVCRKGAHYRIERRGLNNYYYYCESRARQTNERASGERVDRGERPRGKTPCHTTTTTSADGRDCGAGGGSLFGRRRISRGLNLTQPLPQITSSLQNNFAQNNDGGRGLPPVAAGKVGPGRLDYDFMRQRSHFGLGLSREKVRARGAIGIHGMILIEGQWEIHVSELCG